MSSCRLRFFSFVSPSVVQPVTYKKKKNSSLPVSATMSGSALNEATTWSVWVRQATGDQPLDTVRQQWKTAICVGGNAAKNEYNWVQLVRDNGFLPPQQKTVTLFEMCPGWWEAQRLSRACSFAFFIRRLYNLSPCCPCALKLEAVLKCKSVCVARGVPQGWDSAHRCCIMFLPDEAGQSYMSCCVDTHWTGGASETWVNAVLMPLKQYSWKWPNKPGAPCLN